jgi:hypothetical protein
MQVKYKDDHGVVKFDGDGYVLLESVFKGVHNSVKATFTSHDTPKNHFKLASSHVSGTGKFIHAAGSFESTGVFTPNPDNPDSKGHFSISLKFTLSKI